MSTLIFVTADGFRLRLAGGEWVDGDLTFRDCGCHPVDCHGNRIDGRLVSEGDWAPSHPVSLSRLDTRHLKRHTTVVGEYGRAHD